MTKYGLVIMYDKQMDRCNDSKYVIFELHHPLIRSDGEENAKKIFQTNIKEELYMWLDLNGLTFGKRTCDKRRCKHFKEFMGLAINLKKKRV